MQEVGRERNWEPGTVNVQTVRNSRKCESSMQQRKTGRICREAGDGGHGTGISRHSPWIYRAVVVQGSLLKAAGRRISHG